MPRIEEVAVAGVGTVASQRKPGPGVSTPGLLARALRTALEDAGIPASEVDGLGVGSFSLAPDRTIDLAWHLGLRLRWMMEDVTTMNLVHHAVHAIRSGDATTIAILGGDHLMGAGYGAMVDDYNRVTREHLAPLPTGGPNPLFALVTQEHMDRHGLSREDYGRVVISQRAFAGTNPYAAYREPLAIEEYLAAPVVSDPLTIFDCPPIVAGAEAIVLTAEDRGPPGRRRVAIRAIASSFNHDQQAGDGLRTGLSQIADGLWRDGGVGPEDVDVAELYDDYPVIVLAQLEDLGLIRDGDASAILRGPGRSRPGVNTGGGMLAAGQAGAAGGIQGFVEAVRQLRHERGDGQIAGARIAVVAGYAMVLYRYGACSVGAVLEGLEAR
ncbi:MAG TPA: thiolase family protein [Solirubrobacteraceae bacterium]|nr:thiolase family protein [Solirubrobacteraceae bacterium]